VDTAVKKVRVVKTQGHDGIIDSLSVYNMVHLGGNCGTVHVLGTDVEFAAWVI